MPRLQEARRFGHLGAAFELDHLRAGGHQGDGVAQRLLRAFLEAAEGHVGDHPARWLPRTTLAVW
jgi:hypothetical protein